MEARANIPPGLPRPNPTTSYWQLHPSPLAHHQSTPSLPSHSQYVIIGSGITGASIAWHLLKQQPSAQVLLLEARAACTGATGRNGGHTKAASYRAFLAHLASHGEEEAIRIARLERQCVQAMQAFARDHSIECDITPCETLDVFFESGQWEAALQATRVMNQICQGQDVETYEIIDSAEEAQKISLCPGAIGALKYWAGSVSAYKLTTGLLKLALESGLNLQTGTPAESVTQETDGRWRIETPRGNVRAEKVILATNAFTAHLVPEFQGVIVPLRGHCTAQQAGTGLPKPAYPRTASFFYATGYEYMIPRPAGSEGEGDVIIGGGRTVALPNEGMAEFGETNDTQTLPPLVDYLVSCTEGFWGNNWGADAHGGRLKNAWSGVMGCSADGVPYIGEMPGKRDLWVAASFNGHGMVYCFECGRALAGMMLGKKNEVETWFPRSFKIAKERLKTRFLGRPGEKPPPEHMAVRDDVGIAQATI